MNYFIASSLSHNLRFIFRTFEPVVSIVFYHELTNTKTILSNVDCVLNDGYGVVDFDFEFKINSSYTLEVLGSELIYRGKAKAI
tara:strand:- start:830 stop:1081 length:252 start_codon:yes stop_codon:yes gene_type:complete